MRGQTGSDQQTSEEAQTAHEGGEPPGRFAALLGRPRGVLIVTFAFLLLGGIAWWQAPIDIYPERMGAPMVTVNIKHWINSTAKVHDQVTVPAEGLIRGIPGVASVSSKTKTNGTVISVTPGPGVDGRIIGNRIDELLASHRHEFPERMGKPSIRVGGNGSPWVMELAVGAGSMGDDAFHDMIQHELLPGLMAVEGVSTLSTSFEGWAQLTVLLDVSAMQQTGVRAADVFQAVKARIPMSLVASSAVSQRDTRIDIDTGIYNERDLLTLRVRENLPLSAVASIKNLSRSEKKRVWVDGRPTVNVLVRKYDGGDGYRVSLSAQAVLDRLQTTHGFQLIVQEATYLSIHSAFGTIASGALWGAAAACLTLLIFLRHFKATALVCISLPLSMALAMGAHSLLGGGLNLPSLIGFLVSLGLLVDASIVVIEVLLPCAGVGARQRTALVARAVSRVAMALLASTLTTLVVFLPVVLVPSQDSFAVMVGHVALPLALSLLASLVTALILVPLIWCLWKDPQHRRPRALPPGLRSLRRVYIAFIQTLALRPVLSLALVALGFLPLLFLSLPEPTLEQVQAKQRMVELDVKVRKPVSIEQVEDGVRQWMAALEPHRPELGIRSVFADFYPWWARIRVFLETNDPQGRSLDEMEQAIEAHLPPTLALMLRSHQKKSEALSEHQRQRLEGEETAASVSPPRTKPKASPSKEVVQPRSESLRLLVRHPSPEHLPNAWQAVRAVLGEDPRVLKSGRLMKEASSQPLLVMGPTARGLGLESESIVDEVQLRLGQRSIGPLDYKRQLMLGAVDKDVAMHELLALSIPTSEGVRPLSSLVQREEIPSQRQVQRFNGMASYTVAIEVDARQRAELLADLRRLSKDHDLPPGTMVDLHPEQQAAEASGQAMLLACGVAVLLIYLLLGVLHENVLAPLAIMITVPMAIGSLLFWISLTDMPLGLMALLGLLLLFGIAVNNGVVLVDHLCQRVPFQSWRRSPRQARRVALASARRLMPVLLTTLTSLWGALPMALGPGRIAGIPLAGLGQTIAVGLVGSTLFTLVLVPLVYALLGSGRRAASRLARSVLHGSRSVTAGPSTLVGTRLGVSSSMPTQESP
jgi:HAE1 family hydrophobic/amphiphilic exporter-1